LLWWGKNTVYKHSLRDIRGSKGKIFIPITLPSHPKEERVLNVFENRTLKRIEDGVNNRKLEKTAK
jgi:hypothetical protein